MYNLRSKLNYRKVIKLIINVNCITNITPFLYNRCYVTFHLVNIYDTY